jgi:hypothetical protein
MKTVMSEVLKTVTVTILWNVTPGSPVEIHRRFGEIYTADPEQRGSTFLRNAGELVPDYTLLDPRIQYSNLFQSHLISIK